MFEPVVSGNTVQLGAHYDGEGTHFGLFSANAQRVELCIYDAAGQQELTRYDLPEKHNDIWHGYVPKLSPGYCYGYRVHGAYEPEAGHRFNANKLLLDPYSTQQQGRFIWHDAHFAYDTSSSEQDMSFSQLDNAAYMPKAVISEPIKPAVNLPTPWRKPLNQSIIYELHIKGFTKLNEAVTEPLRGTYEGLAQPQVLAYLKALGITTVELLPVHYFVDEYFLHQRKLSNYWGYNSINFFSAHPAYATGHPGQAFKHMVDTLHDAGFEVILDVVYNHTGESDHLGPNLCYRGIDNASYYVLQPDKQRFYQNDTGCGNMLNINQPQVLTLVIDSLRYWASTMGVDGFRFDLAPVLGREPQGFNAQHAFFKAIENDPILARCKLIAEPWDIGHGGYQLGAFPKPWSEWNDKYRDTVRRFWRGDKGILPELAKCLHGSADVYEKAAKAPDASINFITAHDGFTLRDLVCYEQRHNEANGEHNRDGHHDNISCNFGCEGETDQLDILHARLKQQKNLLATLLLSQGVPMLLAGDEAGRSQQGNNNAYCQDNPINWLDWQQLDDDLLNFTKKLIGLRKQYGVLRFPHYVHQPDTGDEAGVYWFNFEGKAMQATEWQEPNTQHCILLLQGGKQQNEPRITLALVFNGSERNALCYLPPLKAACTWQPLLSTCAVSANTSINVSTPITSTERSLSVYRLMD